RKGTDPGTHGLIVRLREKRAGSGDDYATTRHVCDRSPSNEVLLVERRIGSREQRYRKQHDVVRDDRRAGRDEDARLKPSRSFVPLLRSGSATSRQQNAKGFSGRGRAARLRRQLALRQSSQLPPSAV